MAALPSDVARAPSAASLTQRREATPSLAVRSVCMMLALTCAAAGLAVASAYPIMPFAAMVCFVAWIAFAFVRIGYALPTLIALVPVVGFATWTGRFAFEEVDLLVLASAAGGYGARAIGGAVSQAPRRANLPKLTLLSSAVCGLFLASLVISLVRGLDAAGGLRFEGFDGFDWSAGYESALNCVRVFKPFALALLLAPLLLRNLREPGGFDRFGAGMTASLGLGALVVLQERLAFTGLLDFSADYRVTGSFWEMHVGGAALDGFLALTIPFAIRTAYLNPNRVQRAGSLAVLAVAAYAVLVTFSRGVYAAVPMALATLFLLTTRQRVRVDRGAAWTVFFKGCVYAMVIAGTGFLLFRSGGYRAVIAAFCVLATAIPVDRAMRRLHVVGWITAFVAAAILAVFGTAATIILPKGPYVVFAIALFATIGAIVHAERSADRRSASYVVGGWLWLSICAVAVARYWGGSRALGDSGTVLAVTVLGVVAASRLPRSIWPVARREQCVTLGLAAGVLGIVAVFSGGAYMGDRFSATNSDLQYRLGHWKNGIGRLHGADWIVGKGLGRFPATSMFEPPESGSQGSYRLMTTGGEPFVHLTAPHIPIAFGQLFRMEQRIEITPHTRYALTVVGRGADGAAAHFEVCTRHLLYVSECQIIEQGRQTKADADGGWLKYGFSFDSGTMGESNWWLPRPVFLAIGAYQEFDVRSVRLVGPSGVDVVVNGNFRDHLDRWFASSDRYHLPWHTKNIGLAVLLDQGLLGVALFTLLVGGALLRTTFGRGFRHPDAPFVAAAIIAYIVVGLTDSLLDVPRVALLFYLVVLTGLMLRNPHVATAANARGMPAPPAPQAPPAAPAPDASADRARRRQQAFGTRKPA